MTYIPKEAQETRHKGQGDKMTKINEIRNDPTKRGMRNTVATQSIDNLKRRKSYS